MLLDAPTDESVEETLDLRRHARADLVLSAVLAVIAVVYASQAFDLPKTSPNQADIGPRAYPLLILVLLVAATALLALKAVVAMARKARRENPSGLEALPDRRSVLFRIAVLTLVVVVTVAYLELMIPLGFIVSTAVFVAIQVALIGGWRRYRGRRTLIPIAFGLLTSVAIYLLFADSLGVLLPRGILSL